MPSEAGCLALLLDAPLQSWGHESRFERRTTSLLPTFSGVVGLLAAALGVNKHREGEEKVIRQLAKLQMVALDLSSFRRPPGSARLTDYHTVGGGFDKATEPERIPRKAEGGPRDDPVVSDREYLQGGRFAAVLCADPSWQVSLPDGRTGGLGLLAAALRNPKWGLWLGRKSCPPAAPVLVCDVTAPDGMFASKEAALRASLRKVRSTALREKPERHPLPDDTTSLDSFLHESRELTAGERDELLNLNDVPDAFGAPIGHRHTSRRVVRRHPKS
jgi:CRISPR system Cascade subunit CasD